MRSLKAFFIGFSLAMFCLMIWSADLSWAATTIHGPKKYVRAAGKPAVITENFSAPSATAPYKLTMLNGEYGQNRVSSATIKINGREILSERDFNQQVDRIERGISLQSTNELSAELRSAPGSFLTIMIECLDCIDISISSPEDGITTNFLAVMVKGTISVTTDDVGVTVNGHPAAISGHDWAVRLRLREGPNTITAEVADFYGMNAQKSITIHAEAEGRLLSLYLIPENGVGPLSVDFRVPIPTLTISTYEVDFEGDGEIDAILEPVEDFTHTYSQEGIYYPTITTTDVRGVAYSGFGLVHVLDKTKMDGFLRTRWEDMKSALVNQRIDDAISFFAEESKPLYRDIFTALYDELPELVRSMGGIELIYLEDNTAKYRLLSDELYGGQMLTITYYLYFVVDRDGIWKIYRF